MSTIHPRRAGLPIVALLALSSTAFLTILTETMPAAVMPDMAASLQISSGGVGLLVSVYALASAAAAIPVVALARGLPRKPLYVGLVLIFALANAVTALSTSYPLTIASRVVAGLAAGIVWPVICGYAIRLVAPDDMGRALAITLAGSTVALVAGLPLGTALGNAIGWRYSYGLLSVLALLVIVWVLFAVPAAPGSQARQRASIRQVLGTAGLRPILLATLCAMLANYTLYTYMAPLSEALRLPGRTGQGLLLFGIGALLGVVLAGKFVDRWLRPLAMGALVATGVVMLVLVMEPVVVVACVALIAWGTSFGMLPTVFQAATGRVSGENAELATAMLTTTYNLGIFGGGAVGGLLLGIADIWSLQLVVFVFSGIALALLAMRTRHPALRAGRGVHID